MTPLIADLARRLRCTESQVYTLLLTITVTFLVFLGGVVPALRYEAPASAASAAAPTSPPTAGEDGAPVGAVPSSGPPPVKASGLPAPSLGGPGPGPTSAPSPTSVASTSPTTPVTEVDLPRALEVSAYGWATDDLGFAILGVDDESLPVAAKLGQLDAVSFVRLRGDRGETSLVLNQFTDPTGLGDLLSATAAVRACPIREGSSWKEGPRQKLSAVPDYDCSKGVPGTNETGVWTFDLSGLDPLRTAGFALVPATGGASTFRMAFEPRQKDLLPGGLPTDLPTGAPSDVPSTAPTGVPTAVPTCLPTC